MISKTFTWICQHVNSSPKKKEKKYLESKLKHDSKQMCQSIIIIKF